MACLDQFYVFVIFMFQLSQDAQSFLSHTSLGNTCTTPYTQPHFTIKRKKSKIGEKMFLSCYLASIQYF